MRVFISAAILQIIALVDVPNNEFKKGNALSFNYTHLESKDDIHSLLNEIKPPQEEPGIKVPENIRIAFSGAYPDAEVQGWRMEGENYKVMFNDRNMAQIIVYDKTGKFLRKEIELESVDIPATIVGYYKKTYPNETKYKVWLVEDEKKKKMYSSPLGDQMLYFDSDGNYTRSEKRLVEDWDKDQKKNASQQKKK